MRLGLIGFGNIATTLLDLLRQGDAAPLEHLVVLARPAGAAAARARLAGELAGVASGVAVVEDAMHLLAERPDLVVECAGHVAAGAHAPAVLRAGVDVILVSIGALADPGLEASLRAAAAEGSARLILPAGAVGAIDLLSALGAAGGLEVRYRGTKPPAAWAGTPAAEILDLARRRRADGLLHRQRARGGHRLSEERQRRGDAGARRRRVRGHAGRARRGPVGARQRA